jgi:hypothetical protein
VFAREGDYGGGGYALTVFLMAGGEVHTVALGLGGTYQLPGELTGYPTLAVQVTLTDTDGVSVQSSNLALFRFRPAVRGEMSESSYKLAVTKLKAQAVTGAAFDPETGALLLKNTYGDVVQSLALPFVRLASDAVQIVDSDLALSNGRTLYGTKSAGQQVVLVKVADYGSYEQVEVGTETDPLCLNHAAKSIDGTVVGDHIIVNYHDENGGNHATVLVYESDGE